MRIAFVCTGNTCRSPMAEGYMRKRLEEEGLGYIEVISRGLVTNPNLPPTSKAISSMRNYGVDISHHRAQQFDCDEATENDLVLVMGSAHLHVVRFETPFVEAHLFAEYAGEFGEIPDPFGMEQADYDRTAARLVELIDKSLDKIRARYEAMEKQSV